MTTEEGASTTEVVQLTSGRSLGLTVSGPAGGMPLIFHHGTPGANTPVRAMERAAHARGLRLVAASRPGYGLSSPQAGRQVVDVVADTRAILAHLGAKECYVAGWSGGGPHALACAARLEETRATLAIASVAPFEAESLDWLAGMGEDNVVEFNAAIAGETELRPLLQLMGEAISSSSLEGIVESMDTILPDVDKAVLTDEFGEDMLAGFREALKAGVEGWLDDDLAFVKPWGFSLTEIGSPVTIWQGSDDKMVPFSHGQWLGRHVPGADVHLLDGEGHLSVGVGALDAMFDELTAH